MRGRGAPWLRAVLQPNGLLEDTGFGYSPHDYLDLLETLQSVATLGQQQVLAEGLKEALWRRDGRRRTYFCCLYSPGPHPHLDPRRADWSKFDPVVGCGKRLLDVNELKQHVAACKHHGRLCLRLGLCFDRWLERLLCAGRPPVRSGGEAGSDRDG